MTFSGCAHFNDTLKFFLMIFKSEFHTLLKKIRFQKEVFAVMYCLSVNRALKMNPFFLV